MKWTSTRDSTQSCTVSEAISQGLASGGGLFIPESWPNISVEAASLPEFAAEALLPFFSGDALAPRLPEICNQAFNFPIPLKELDSVTSVLELFHGPTSAFKDFGARFLALCLEFISSLEKRMVLVATSGDTGGAVAAAFSQCSTIPVSILYPKNKISERQEIQLTNWGPQVRAFAVDGTFDDCQKLVKQAFVSPKLKNRYRLISANSINVARLLPQMSYFAYISSKYYQQHKVHPSFIIPSGNLGNAAAALWAKKSGFPIHRVIFAHNANQTVPDYFTTGAWAPRPSVPTLANAMDVGNPSNFERIQSLYPQLKDLEQVASAVSVSDEQIKVAIKNGISRWSQIWCPHTATAVTAAEQLRKKYPQEHFILVATADPAKFEKIVEPLVGQTLEVPAPLKKLMAQPAVSQPLEANIESLESLLK
jgi:threonine synthase